MSHFKTMATCFFSIVLLCSVNAKTYNKQALLKDFEKYFLFTEKLKNNTFELEVSHPSPNKLIKSVIKDPLPFKIKKIILTYSGNKNDLKIETDLTGAAKKKAEVSIKQKLMQTNFYKMFSKMTLNFFHEVKYLIIDQATLEVIKYNRDLVDFELTNFDEFILDKKIDSMRITYDRKNKRSKCIIYAANGEFITLESQFFKTQSRNKKKSKGYPVWLRYRSGEYSNKKMKTKVDCKLQFNVLEKKLHDG